MGQIIKSNLFTYYNLIFTILAILIIAAGSLRNLTFLPVVLANLLIGIIQELRAKKILDELTMLSAPKIFCSPAALLFPGNAAPAWSGWAEIPIFPS